MSTTTSHQEQLMSSTSTHQHEWLYGECQTCGETHPEDCLGCAPLSHAVDEHTYQAPDPDAVEWAQHLADEQAHAEGDDGSGY
jgi:hypothetical protein